MKFGPDIHKGETIEITSSEKEQNHVSLQQ